MPMFRSPQNPHLAKDGIDYQSIIDGWSLETKSPGEIELNREGVPINSNHSAFTGTGAKDIFICGYKPNASDQSGSWIPQGMSSSGDADPSGLIDGEKWIATTQYDGSRARISLVKVSQMSGVIPYRVIMLVEPYVDPVKGANFRNIPIHAGGCVWFRNFLYVVDTDYGIRVFDMAQMKLMTGVGDQSKMGKQSDGTYHCQDYKYVVPQVARYIQTSEIQRWSFCGLDQSPDESPLLVTGEWDSAASTTNPTKVHWWLLDDVTGELVDEDGEVTPYDECLASQPGLQGMISVREDDDLIVYANGHSPYRLYKSVVAPSLAAAVPDVWYTWPSAPEGITRFPGLNEAWFMQETGNRIVYAVQFDAL